MINLTLTEEEEGKKENKTPLYSLQSQLLNTISSGLNQVRLKHILYRVYRFYIRSYVTQLQLHIKCRSY